MRAIVVSATGGPEALAYTDHPDPELNPGRSWSTSPRPE